MGLKQDPQVRPRTERSASPIGRQPRCQRGAWGADGARPHRTSSFRFQSQRPSLLSPISLRSLYRSLYRSLALSLSLSTPWHGGDGTKPPPKPLWIAEYTDYETISMRMITVRRRTAFGHGDQYHRDAMGPSSLFSVKTIPG